MNGLRKMHGNGLVVLVAALTFQIIAITAASLHDGAGRVGPFSLSRGGGGKAKEDTTDIGRMPSLFTADEAQYDRYSACLAATEGLRRLRDKEIGEEEASASSMRRKRWWGRGGKASKAELNEGLKRISAEYVVNSRKVLKALGMSVSQFNQLSRQVSQDKKMKERVMEQAYLYRMASTLDMDRVPLIEDPASEDLLKATRRERVQMFCESMTEIEQLRADQMKKLKRSLHVEKLPRNIRISDPSVMPFLSPKVRAVVEAFPLQAEEIVKRYGLNSDEFNQMLEETRSNPVFRWRVQKYLKQKGPKEGKSKE